MAAKRVARERILIIMDLDHANRVFEAAAEYKLASEKKPTAPTEARLARIVVIALRMIFNRGYGWYDTTFREALKQKVREENITPVLTHEELQQVMDNVYALIPPRDDTAELEELRMKRLNESQGKK